ncbi:hypothetical protein Q8A67_022520 [Cirrhinus molitorella]|uniref:Uncharacterized protein n=1 Tax=Cirrhinus molitorella TaxID=172907 RepID=A0AA88P6U1_9TELE|nr:hypothetical protein Q8A67_022520 [Cirrhinus molitorella]
MYKDECSDRQPKFWRDEGEGGQQRQPMSIKRPENGSLMGGQGRHIQVTGTISRAIIRSLVPPKASYGANPISSTTAVRGSGPADDGEATEHPPN